MRRLWILIVAALLSSALVEAQITSYGEVRAGGLDATAPKHSVSGTVVNSATSEPIPRALVQIMGLQQRSDFTDSQGNFHFEGVLEGPARFTARKPGYFNSEELAHGGGGLGLSLGIGADVPSIVIKLTPEGVVTGTITGEDGEPLERVQLRFRRQVVFNGRKQWQDRMHATTNEDGEFRAASLPPGAYYILAEDTRPITPRTVAAEPGMGYPPSYYPGVPDVSSAAAVNVMPGQVVRVDFRLRVQPVYEIAGVITGMPPGRPAQVELTNSSGEAIGVRVRLNPQDGRFSAQAPAGTYIIRASARDQQNGWSGTSTVTVGGNVSNFRLALQPAISIPIVVKTDFTKTRIAPADSGVVGFSKNARNIRRQSQPASVSLTSLDGNRANSFPMMEPMTDNATSGLRNVEPGRYAVQISPHGPWYVQSATYGQTDLLRDDLVVTQGGEAGAMEIVLRDDGGSVNGSVMFDNTPVNAMVLVVPERRSAIPPAQYANESSGFRIHTLAPGNYLLYAFDSIEGLEYSNREALDAYASRATRVSVSNNTSANATLTLIKRAEQ
jgi:hypothetical protein